MACRRSRRNFIPYVISVTNDLHPRASKLRQLPDKGATRRRSFRAKRETRSFQSDDERISSSTKSSTSSKNGHLDERANYILHDIDKKIIRFFDNSMKHQNNLIFEDERSTSEFGRKNERKTTLVVLSGREFLYFIYIILLQEFVNRPNQTQRSSVCFERERERPPRYLVSKSIKFHVPK